MALKNAKGKLIFMIFLWWRG